MTGHVRTQSRTPSRTPILGPRLALILLFVVAVAVSANPFADRALAQTPASTFFGSGLKFNDTVEAFIAGKSCGTPVAANDTGAWLISVAPTAPCAPTDGAAVTFTLNGAEAIAAPAATWKAGARSQHVLSVKPNAVPVADAGPTQSVTTGAVVTLNGTRSTDPDGGPSALAYSWRQAAGPLVTLTGAATASPTFNAPPGPASLTFSLVVSDGAASSGPSAVTIRVAPPPNVVPVADAGPPQTVASGSKVTLNGTGSRDPDRGPSPLTYSWTKTAGPAFALAGATTSAPTFTAPPGPATVTFALVVRDGGAQSAPSLVTITVLPPPLTTQPNFPQDAPSYPTDLPTRLVDAGGVLGIGLAVVVIGLLSSRAVGRLWPRPAARYSVQLGFDEGTHSFAPWPAGPSVVVTTEIDPSGYVEWEEGRTP